ncbi:prolipoprotein diacylglyceryl transferase [Spiroplasma diminutum]|uniref:Prolipoprotein diacylglyceryl transferase n=1 Tax=Spiroplasma diminutum CUAS-1 TaxID=1276221 RepID=S5MIN2_9MOLU|nr:prolipoprotein diacylglyceryl transferase family protein [Spiroplasma diminutum]AGR41775.1 prolipoprotein diacylglyceryl transferase [Spiroplasma diminutum CUAS-1]
MFYGWIQGNNWVKPDGIWTVKENYGFIHVYALTMTLGVIFAIGISAIKLYRRGIPLTELWVGAAIVVPFSLMGASFFGKLNSNGLGTNGSSFLDFLSLFAFWEGGMAIHGGVYTGTLIGIIMFYFIGKRTKVSLWIYADCIVPNVLVGQGIGRWGNFFNHEIFGKPIAVWNNGNTSALNWLPNFIRTNMVWKYQGNGETLNGLELIDNTEYIMNPIFLYESISLITAWVIITFVIPNIGKWIGKKPWKLHPNTFTIETPKYKIWRSELYANHDKKDIELYKKEILNINDKNYIKRKWKQGKLLDECNNPEKYTIIRTGVQAGLYFFIWNLVRFILELGRPDDHLFLMYQRTLSLTIIGLSMFIGLSISLLAQFVVPYLFRQPGWIYEQEYFYLEEKINFSNSEQNIQVNNLKEENKEIKLQKKVEKNRLKEEKIKASLKKKLEIRKDKDK